MEGFALERVVVSDEPSDAFVPHAVPTVASRSQLVVTQIQHLQLLELLSEQRNYFQAGQLIGVDLKGAKIGHGALVIAPLVEDELVLKSIVGDVQMLHAFHLHPGVAGRRVEVHVLNGEFLNFVEPGEAPVESQHIWIADIPMRMTDLGSAFLLIFENTLLYCLLVPKVIYQMLTVS